MGQLAVRRPLSALRLVNEAVLPGATDGDALELEIHSQSRDISVRDFAAYLELADHVYGRLHPDGYRSYVMRPSEHVRIEDVRTGTMLISIPGIVANASPLVILFLCLKYLPTGVERFAVAYNNYEQARLARENRRKIRLDMERDPSLAALPRERRRELATLVESLLESDGELFVRARRFADESVIEVQVRLKDK